MISRFIEWNIWRKKSLDSKAYKLFVLFGLTKSPTFEFRRGWYEQGDKMKSVLFYDRDEDILRAGLDSLQDLLNGNEYEVNRIYALIGILEWILCHLEKVR